MVEIGSFGMASTAGATSVTATVDCLAGRVLVAYISWDAGTLSIADDRGNTWTQLGSDVTDGGVPYTTRVYYTAAAGGALGKTGNRITATSTSSAFITLCVYEFFNLDTTAASLDAQVGVLDTASPFASGNLTSVRGNCILIGLASPDAVANPTVISVSGTSNPASGWLGIGGERNGNQNVLQAFAVNVGSTSTTYNFIFTTTGSGSGPNGISRCISFRGPGPGITTQPANAEKYNGETATFSIVVGTSVGSVTQKWQSSTDNVNWNDIGGETSTSYTTAALTYADHGKLIRCAVLDDNGTNNSFPAQIQIKPKADLAWFQA